MKKLLLLAMAVVLVGCASPIEGIVKNNKANMQKLSLGMSKAQVLETMGPADKTEAWKLRELVDLYVSEKISPREYYHRRELILGPAIPPPAIPPPAIPPPAIPPPAIPPPAIPPPAIPPPVIPPPVIPPPVIPPPAIPPPAIPPPAIPPPAIPPPAIPPPAIPPPAIPPPAIPPPAPPPGVGVGLGVGVDPPPAIPLPAHQDYSARALVYVGSWRAPIRGLLDVRFFFRGRLGCWPFCLPF